jgi:hypothetical protein
MLGLEACRQPGRRTGISAGSGSRAVAGRPGSLVIGVQSVIATAPEQHKVPALPNNPLYFYQGGSAALRRWPGAAPGSALGDPPGARRATCAGVAISRLLRQAR